MTAVEWFNQQLVDKQIGKGDSRDWDTIFEEAKQMEKQEKMEAFIEGYKQRAEASNLIFDNSSRMYAINLFEIFNKICEHCYITSADWKSQTCTKCHHRINF
jgi:ribosomal protein L40E